MSGRKPLPNRRMNETHKIQYNGQTVFVTIGYDNDGRAREVFASTNKTGTELDNLIADACVITSLVLQHNHDPHRLLTSLGTVPDLTAGEEDATKPASILGVMVELVANNMHLGRNDGT